MEEVKPPKSYFYHSTTRIHTLSMVIKLKGLATCYIKLSSFNSLLQQQSCIKNKFYLVSLCSFIIIYFLFFLSFFLLLSFFLWLSLSLMACLEVSRMRRVEGRRVVERRVEWNGYPPPCLDVFKISKREGSN